MGDAHAALLDWCLTRAPGSWAARPFIRQCFVHLPSWREHDTIDPVSQEERLMQRMSKHGFMAAPMSLRHATRHCETFFHLVEEKVRRSQCNSYHVG